MVGLDLHPVLDLDDRHGCIALQQFHQNALVGRVQMLNDDKAKTAPFGHMPKELLQGLQSAGGSAKTNDGERAACLAPGFRKWSGRGLTNNSSMLMLLTDTWRYVFHGLEGNKV